MHISTVQASFDDPQCIFLPCGHLLMVLSAYIYRTGTFSGPQGILLPYGYLFRFFQVPDGRKDTRTVGTRHLGVIGSEKIPVQ